MSRVLVISLAFLAACKGAQGDLGPAGAEGLDALVHTVAEPAGENCADGGVAVHYGTDVNADGALGVDEISGTTYVCNGENGTNGENGEDAVALLFASENVFENAMGCPFGYQDLKIGYDNGANGGVAGDGLLQEGEVLSHTSVCLAPDLDDDGRYNTSDLCPEDADPEQENADYDAFGDACDGAAELPVVYAYTRGTSSLESNLYIYDLASNTGTLVGAMGHAVGSLKVNPADGKLYALTRDGDVGGCDNCLFEVDPATATTTLVKEINIYLDPDAGGEYREEIDPSEYPDSMISSMAFLADGSLFGWTEYSDHFVRVDLATGLAYALGVNINSWGHSMCSTSEGTLLWINGDGVIREFSPDGSFVERWGLPAHLHASGQFSEEYGLRGGDCHPDSWAFVGLDLTYGDDPQTVVNVQIWDQGESLVLSSETTDILDLYGFAFKW